MFEGVDHRYRCDARFDLGAARTRSTTRKGKATLVSELEGHVAEIDRLQRLLFAQNQAAMLVIFQAMDAAGKDGTIRAVFTGVDPAGCHVTAFKRPSSEELDHDFLWRHVRHLPERGRIGVFNRSWYEEVLVARVHPQVYAAQPLPFRPKKREIWTERYESIADLEKHLARNGTAVLKFFLHVSREEQKKRLLERLQDPTKRWKFEVGDVDERDHWDDYQEAYEAAIRATSRDHAPWYAIPADSKSYARATVAEIVAATLRRMDPQVPRLDEGAHSRIDALEARLQES